ncbi:MAG: hypothetical protein WKG01_05325 [Kofleriaceae bacterium]
MEVEKAVSDRAQHRGWHLASSSDPRPAVSLTCHRLEQTLSVDRTDDLGEETALRAACKRRQQWLVKTFTSPKERAK